MSVAVIMGSISDKPRLDGAVELLDQLGISWERRVLSAHRTPDACVEYVRQAEARGVQVFIAAAGLAAHLPGVVAAHTRRPVIGVPIAAGPLSGQDALLSIAQMPPGVPVATVGIDNGKNAAILAAQIIALADARVDGALEQFRRQQAEKVLAADASLQEQSK